MIDYRIGDCRELLKEIPDESVRLVVTSPPYNIGKPYGHYKDKIPLDKWQELISDVTREVYRILASSNIYIGTFRIIALARATRCFSPPDKLVPFSDK